MSFNSNKDETPNERTSLVSSKKSSYDDRTNITQSTARLNSTKKLNQSFYANQLLLAMNDTRNQQEKNASIIILLVNNFFLLNRFLFIKIYLSKNLK